MQPAGCRKSAHVARHALQVLAELLAVLLLCSRHHRPRLLDLASAQQLQPAPQKPPSVRSAFYTDHNDTQPRLPAPSNPIPPSPPLPLPPPPPPTPTTS